MRIRSGSPDGRGDGKIREAHGKTRGLFAPRPQVGFRPSRACYPFISTSGSCPGGLASGLPPCRPHTRHALLWGRNIGAPRTLTTLPSLSSRTTNWLRSGALLSTRRTRWPPCPKSLSLVLRRRGQVNAFWTCIRIALVFTIAEISPRRRPLLRLLGVLMLRPG